MMFTDEIKRELEHCISDYPTRGQACIEGMLILQRHRGWLSDESIRELAVFLDMTVEELDSVASFYNHLFRKQVGRHVIWVCDSVSCWILGYESLLEHLEGRLGVGFGETTADGRFTLLPIQCLGACDQAPAMMIDTELHADLTPQKLDEILERYP
jgi:NADH-quinone oxidoreductase subunit E